MTVLETDTGTGTESERDDVTEIGIAKGDIGVGKMLQMADTLTETGSEIETIVDARGKNTMVLTAITRIGPREKGMNSTYFYFEPKILTSTTHIRLDPRDEVDDPVNRERRREEHPDDDELLSTNSPPPPR